MACQTHLSSAFGTASKIAATDRRIHRTETTVNEASDVFGIPLMNFIGTWEKGQVPTIPSSVQITTVTIAKKIAAGQRHFNKVETHERMLLS